MKKGFSLIEIMVSVTLLSIMMLYFHESVSTLRKSTDFYEEKFKSLEGVKKYVSVLQQDLILNIGEVKLHSKDNKRYTILELRTTNSLYNIEAPYVLWYVQKKDKKLFRIESLKKITLPIVENFHYYFLDEVAINVNDFKVYNSKQDILVYINQRNFSDIVFEVPNI